MKLVEYPTTRAIILDEPLQVTLDKNHRIQEWLHGNATYKRSFKKSLEAKAKNMLTEACPTPWHEGIQFIEGFEEVVIVDLKEMTIQVIAYNEEVSDYLEEKREDDRYFISCDYKNAKAYIEKISLNVAA